MNNQTNRREHRRFLGIWKQRKRRCFPAAMWLLVFALAAAGFPAAVLGQELQALSQSRLETSMPPEPPVYIMWEDFRSSFGSHNHALALEAGAGGTGSIAIDGSLDEWGPYAELRLPQNEAQLAMTGWSGPEDVSASVYMAYDEQYFYWAARVTDNVHTPVSDSTMWRGDSIQFAFSPDGTYGPEYGINYMDGQAHVWQFSEGKAIEGAAQITVAAVQGGNEIVYEVKMPWSTIYTGKPETNVLPFTMLFNDNDGAGRRGWMEWTPGIGKAKSPASHAQVHLIPAETDWSFWVEGPKEVPVSATVEYAVYAVNWESAPVTLQLKSEALGADRSLTVPGRTVAEVRLPFAPAEAGDHPLDFALTASGGGERQQELVATAVMTPAEVEARLNAVAAKLPQLEGLLQQCEAQGLATDYERINYAVIKDFIGYGKEDIVQGRLSRAYYVAVELQELYEEAAGKLQGYLNGSGTPLAVPRYVTGRPAIDGYSFVGDTKVRSTGAVEERPIFFTGYGAFTKVREDIPKFQDLGANAIQIEIGPRDVILDKKDFINQYSVSRAGNVNAAAEVVEGVSHSGLRSLQISNSSPYQSNVYINVAQTIAVEPNTTYQFKVWVKGNNARNTWFPGGASMKQRKSFPSGTYDWQEVVYEYTTGPQETSYKLMVLSENTGVIWVDDLWVGKLGSDVNLVANSGFEDLGGYDENKEYVVSTGKIQSDIEQALTRAATHDVAVNLLISPHYFPAWALTKWPELNVANNGFIKFSLFQPMAQAIMEDYLRALIPAVKDYPSLHSITLTNESVYQSNKDAYALPFWHSYLEELYGGDIGELNRVYQSGYAAFTEVPMPANVTASPWSYDYVMFNNDYFSRWHEWMAGIIHELAPELAVHAKIMGDPRGSLSWGVDIERFSEFSQINGNDNWNYIN
ncbi:sugar-binding protein, partial [Paenibacillus sp. YN15]|uniref:sugar-binding protein n=1 Tax=Paenibacillus sp. YN15 TaxID=1742774 RepID=UPI0015EC884E